MVPKKIFLTKGVGVHKQKLRSFEQALRMAGIQVCNLVCVSSIFPPHCKLIPKIEGIKLIKPGVIQFAVMAKNETDEANRLISSSIGLARPLKGAQYGYLSEHHAYGEDAKTSGDYAEDIAASMLAETLGLTTFNADHAWDNRQEVYKSAKGIFTARNITQTAVGIRGCWVTTVAAAILLE